MPIFREVSLGGSTGAGRFKMSLASWFQECFATGRGIAAKYLILTELILIHHGDAETRKSKIN